MREIGTRRLRSREGARRRSIRKPGDLPNDTLLGRGHTRDAPSNSRGAGRFSNRSRNPSCRTGGSNDDRHPSGPARRPVPARSPSSQLRRPRRARALLRRAPAAPLVVGRAARGDGSLRRLPRFRDRARGSLRHAASRSTGPSPRSSWRGARSRDGPAPGGSRRSPRGPPPSSSRRRTSPSGPSIPCIRRLRRASCCALRPRSRSSGRRSARTFSARRRSSASTPCRAAGACRARCGRSPRPLRGGGPRLRAAGAARLREHRRHGDLRAGGRDEGRLGDHGRDPRGAREARVGRRFGRAALDPRARRRPVRNARLADLALHPRDQLDADARPDRRRAHELAVLLGLRLVGNDDREHRADRDRARPLLRALRLGRHRRRRADLYAARRRRRLRSGDGGGGQRGPGAGLGVRLRGRGPDHRDGELPLRRLRRRPPEHRLAPAQRLGEPRRRVCPTRAGSAWSGA